MKKVVKKCAAMFGIDLYRRRYPSVQSSTAESDSDVLSEWWKKSGEFSHTLSEIRRRNPIQESDGTWFPHDILSNLDAINRTLTGKSRDLPGIIGSGAVADIGGADGDISFFLEHLGISNIHLIDCARINCSRQKGARILKEMLNSQVTIHDIDIDSFFTLPEKHFSLILLLGTLYHLKNPFYVLESLAKYTDYCLLSTRISRFLPGKTCRISDEPIAYLLNEDELNHDPSNFWIFSEKGLQRILHRTGWEVLNFRTFDNTVDSVPDSLSEGERVFCMIKSRREKILPAGAAADCSNS